MSKFWNFVDNKGVRELRIDGIIAENSWFGDEVTPGEFRRELYAQNGDLDLWLSSNGGDFFAAAKIYTMLKEYPHKVTVKVDSIAASAASVIAMSGDEILLSPVACLVIHNPYTVAVGDSGEMQKTSAMLDEIKQAIINAYQTKTKLSRQKISEFMDESRCFNAKSAVEFGFADGILYDNSGVSNFLGSSVLALEHLPKEYQIPMPKVKKIKNVKSKKSGVLYSELVSELNKL